VAEAWFSPSSAEVKERVKLHLYSPTVLPNTCYAVTSAVYPSLVQFILHLTVVSDYKASIAGRLVMITWT
jgi:hypothetical protein